MLWYYAFSGLFVVNMCLLVSLRWILNRRVERWKEVAEYGGVDAMLLSLDKLTTFGLASSDLEFADVQSKRLLAIAETYASS